MNHLVDPRVVRTKHFIHDAMLDLIEEKNIEGLNVRNLTERAGINRGTFYLHYHDIRDMLEQYKTEMLQGLKMNCKDTKSRFSQAAKQDSEPTLIRVFEYFAEHHRFFKVMLASHEGPLFIHQMQAFLKEEFREVLKSLPGIERLSIPQDYLIAFVTSAILGTIKHWFQNEMNLSPKEMAQMVYQMIELGPIKSAVSV